MNIFAEAKNVLDKDGKVNALGPYGKQKLTGREMSTYFRRNKVKDATIKKAVEVALDLGGADTIARQEIKKFYGDKVLKSKEVQKALQYANESFTYNQSLNQITEENLTEKNLMPDIQKIVDTKGAKKVGGIMVDMFTASMINQIYNKVNDQNKKKMEKANISTLVDIAQRIMQKNSVQKEAVSPAQQAAIAIAKKEKGEKPKNEDAEAKAKLALKHAQDMKKLKDKQAREKEAMQESDMQDVDKAPKNKWKALGFSQHPHKGFEDERLPKDMRDFRKQAKTPSQMRVEDAYRAMWEDGQKYAPIEENFDKDPDIKKISMATQLFAKDDLAKLKDFIAKNKLDKKKIVKDLEKKMNQRLFFKSAVIGNKKNSKLKDKIIQTYKEETVLGEEVANITVDPKNRINSGQQQAYHGMEIAKQARRFGLKSAVMHKHVRIKGAKKAVNDFLRIVIGKSRYGDPTEKDMSTPQIDKMLTKGLK